MPTHTPKEDTSEIKIGKSSSQGFHSFTLFKNVATIKVNLFIIIWTTYPKKKHEGIWKGFVT
jgi:hypothetical protein